MKKWMIFQDIEVSRSETALIIANSRLRREFDLSSGAPRTVSLKNADGMELADHAKTDPDFAFIGMSPAGADPAIPWSITDLAAEIVPGSFLDSEHVKISITMVEAVSETEYLREYRIYPDFPAISVENIIRPKVLPNLYWTPRGALNQEPFRPDVRESCADSLRCAPQIHPVKLVSFLARTDYYDQQVQEQIPGETPWNGNVLFCENSDSAGFLYLQEAPPSGERRDLEPHDFTFRDHTVRSCCWGIHPSEIRPGNTFRGYRHDLILYRSAAERSRVLKEFLKKRFAPKPYSVMVNPWGCGRFPSLVNEAFLIDEMKAAPEVGATHYQIDDAWQEGGSLAQLESRNKHITPAFWKISQERLGGSFQPIMTAAKHAGIEPSLWMAPSNNCEYADWKIFADRVLELHREYGFKAFKIDAVKIRSYDAEQNLRSLLAYVRSETGGNVYFNLDTTNGQRPGYFHFLEYGNIFLENRYVCHEWGVGYHPEKTLRSLWKLAKYMRPQELQIEIPYAGDINDKFYADKPWCSPRSYPQEYWAAIAMFANPLLWFAPSTVKPEDRPAIRTIMELHKRHRDNIFAGEIYPVGQEPDGKAVTGFHSCGAENGREYLIVYREAGSSCDTAEISLEQGVAADWEILGGAGDIRRSERNSITLHLPECASYLFLGSKCNLD